MAAIAHLAALHIIPFREAEPRSTVDVNIGGLCNVLAAADQPPTGRPQSACHSRARRRDRSQVLESAERPAWGAEPGHERPGPLIDALLTFPLDASPSGEWVTHQTGAQPARPSSQGWHQDELNAVPAIL